MPRAGSLNALRLEREELPPPGHGEVRIAVRAAGLNLADVFACLGLYSATPPGAFVPGLEVAGVVAAVGPDALGPVANSAAAFRAGDRVIGLTRFGGYATSLNADSRYIRRLHESWSFTEGAAFPVQALTAWHAVHVLGRLQPGELALVHSAAGGVGLNALVLLDRVGARVIATVGSEAKRGFLVDRCRLMKDQVIVRDRRRFGDQLNRALGAEGAGGLDLVLDGVGGPYFEPAYQKLRAGGRYVLFGASDFMPAGDGRTALRLLPRYLNRPWLDPLRMINTNRSVAGFNLIWLWDRLDDLAATYDRTVDDLPDPPFVGRTFPFAEAPAALRWLKGGASVGKVVLETSSART
jgi:alcohol dehydrogenase